MRRYLRPALWFLVGGHVVLLLVLAFGGTDPAGPRASVQRGGDFLHCWAGGAAIVEHGPEALYQERSFTDAQQAVLHQRRPYPPAYPPPLYQACWTLVPLGYGDASRVFILAVPIMWGLGLGLLLLAVPGLEQRQRTAALLLGLASPALVMNSVTGQTAGVWMLLISGGLLLWSRGQTLLAGCVLGLLCAKPGIAAPVALTLAVTLQGRAFLGFVLGGGALVAASAALFGVQPWLDWVDLVRGGALGEMMVVPWRHHTLSGLLAYPVRRTDLEGPARQLAALLGVALVLFVAWRARRPEPEDRDGLFRLGAVLSAALLASPHLLGYDVGTHAAGFVLTSVLVLQGRARRPRLGAAVLVLAFFAPVMFPLSRMLHFSLGSATVLAWVLWMRSELPRRAAAPPGPDPEPAAG